MMVSFDDPSLGDSCDELEKLGGDFACEILLYLQKVLSKRVDYRNLLPFYTYQGVEMFLASMGNKFVIFAVEIDNAGDLKITLMLAGEHGVASHTGTFSWDGVRYADLKVGLLNARAAAWFV